MSTIQDAPVPTLRNINDALDILLKKYNIEHVQPSGMNMLLKDNLNNIEHVNLVEVKMEPAEKSSQETNCVDIRKRTLFCHICNLDIPSVFMTEHTNSDKHITLLKLAHKAMERVNKHISQQINRLSYIIHQAEEETDCNNNLPDSVYCIDCNEIVANDSLALHKLKVEHKIFVEKDKLMFRLLDLYGDENIANGNVIINSEKNASEAEVKQEVTDDYDTVKQSSVTSLKDATVRLEKPKDVTNKETPQEDTGAVVNIFAKNGDKVAVSKLNWHSICLCEDKYFNCNLCDALLEPIGHLEQHLKMTTHLEKVNVFVEDKNCIRKLPNETVHCIICNSIHLSEEFHMSRESHKQSVEAAVALYIRGLLELHPTKPTSYIEPLKPKEKSKEMKSFYSKKTITKNKPKREPYICPVCQVKVSNNMRCIMDHTNGKSHKKKLLQGAQVVEKKSSDPVVQVKASNRRKPQSVVRVVPPDSSVVRVVPPDSSVVMCPLCRECCPGALLKVHMERSHGLKQVSQSRTQCLVCHCVFSHYDHVEMNIHLTHSRLCRYGNRYTPF